MQEPGYYIDLNDINLEKFRDNLKNSRLLPSQQKLLENTDKRFITMEDHGIYNMEQLKNRLKTKKDVLLFSDETGLPVDYLTILRREVNSYQPKPIRLTDFPDIDSQNTQQLGQLGIKNTKQLFPFVRSPIEREELAERSQIDSEAVLELTKLTDVARVKWVGPKFARLLVESEFDTVEKIAYSDYQELYAALGKINESTGIYKGKLGIEDMKQWVLIVARDKPPAIQY